MNIRKNKLFTYIDLQITIPIIARFHLSRILSFCGMLAPPVIIVFVMVAGMLTPGYNHLTDTISCLSAQGSQNPNVLTAGFIIYGVLITGFAYALFLRLRHGIKAWVAWLTLTLYGVCMILAGVFQNSSGANITVLNTEGILHNVSVIISCLSVLTGMWMFAGSVYKKPSWYGFTWFTIGASFLGLVLSIFFLLQSQVPFSGLFQRIFYFIILIWLEIVSVWLFRLSFK